VLPDELKRRVHHVQHPFEPGRPRDAAVGHRLRIHLALLLARVEALPLGNCAGVGRWLAGDGVVVAAVVILAPAHGDPLYAAARR
jgi:hypothetical protein